MKKECSFMESPLFHQTIKLIMQLLIGIVTHIYLLDTIIYLHTVSKEGINYASTNMTIKS